MIEETGQVIAIDGAWAIVATQRHGGCGHCTGHKGDGQCGTAAITQMFSPQQPQLRVQNLIQSRVGDQVVLGITEKGLLQATALLYGLPLLTLISGTLAGQWLSLNNIALGMELSSLLGGLFGLSAGFGLVWHYSNRVSFGAACQILRRSTSQVIVTTSNKAKYPSGNL